MGKKDIGSTVLRVLGWLGVVSWLWILVRILILTNPDAARFQSDNAVGAAANGIEFIIKMLSAWLNFFGAVAFFILASLRDIRLKLMSAPMATSPVQDSDKPTSQCPHCHHALIPGALFCKQCGGKIGG